MRIRSFSRALVAVAFAVFAVRPYPASADMYDNAIFSGRIQLLQQMQSTQQMRIDNNRRMDFLQEMNLRGAFSRGGGGSGSGGVDPAVFARIMAKNDAAWRATISVVAPGRSGELKRYLARIKPADRPKIEEYLRHRMAAFPGEARRAGYPATPPTARLFALQNAYLAVRTSEGLNRQATALMHYTLDAQLGKAFLAKKASTAQKEAVLDYYLILGALLAVASEYFPEVGHVGDAERAQLAALARAFVKNDYAGVDPAKISWTALPCVGADDAGCSGFYKIADMVGNL
jgi:hypothetical protein